VTKNGYINPEGQQKMQKFALFLLRKVGIVAVGVLLGISSDLLKNSFFKLGLLKNKDEKAKIGPIKLHENSLNSDAQDNFNKCSEDSRELSGNGGEDF
jgi:hypothetical protein